ncbi:MAG: DUF563 domain-containing protein, partial [Candidatus Paceibacteria bacterium]
MTFGTSLRTKLNVGIREIQSLKNTRPISRDRIYDITNKIFGVYDYDKIELVCKSTDTIFPGKNIEINPPKNKSSIPRQEPGENTKIGEHNLQSFSVGSLPNAKIIGEIPIILTAQNNVIEITGRAALAEAIYRNLSGFNFQKRNTEQIEYACLISGTWENNYFHWTSEYAPQLIGCDYFSTQFDIKPTWKIEFIRSFGFEDKDIITHTSNLRVENLIISFGHRQNYIPHPDVMNWFKDTARSNFQKRQSNDLDGIYISRQRQDSRDISNYEELYSWLKQNNIKPVYFEDLSYEDEVRLMQSVDLIIAPHGAGLTSMIYTDDTKVVELFPEGIFRSTYFVMANVLEHEYYYTMGKTVNDKEAREPHIKVDIDSL